MFLSLRDPKTSQKKCLACHGKGWYNKQSFMIVIDTETSGLSPAINSILSIGAVDLDSGHSFYGECFITPFRQVESAALAVNGFSMASIEDQSKPSDGLLYASFLEWALDGKRERLLGGQQVGSFDILFLREIHDRTQAVKWPFGHRSVDLHSVAFAKFGRSMSLDDILVSVGLSPEPRPHNALNGARLEAVAFKLLLKQ